MATFLAGQTLTAAALEALVSAWASYTPTWTASGTAPVLGNGTLSGRYKQIGKLVHVEIGLLAGTTTTYGTGQWQFLLPATADYPGGAFAENRDVGGYQAFDTSGAARYVGHNVLASSGSNLVCLTNNSPTAIGTVGATVPFTWATGDRLTINATYRAA